MIGDSRCGSVRLVGYEYIRKKDMGTREAKKNLWNHAKREHELHELKKKKQKNLEPRIYTD